MSNKERDTLTPRRMYCYIIKYKTSKLNIWSSRRVFHILFIQFMFSFYNIILDFWLFLSSKINKRYLDMSIMIIYTFKTEPISNYVEWIRKMRGSKRMITRWPMKKTTTTTSKSRAFMENEMKRRVFIILIECKWWRQSWRLNTIYTMPLMYKHIIWCDVCPNSVNAIQTTCIHGSILSIYHTAS